MYDFFLKAAVEALNSLQSNAAVLEKARLQKDRQAVYNVRNTEKFLNRVGISLDMIDKQLKIIHVSGTKVHAFLLLITSNNSYII